MTHQATPKSRPKYPSITSQSNAAIVSVPFHLLLPAARYRMNTARFIALEQGPMRYVSMTSLEAISVV